MHTAIDELRRSQIWDSKKILFSGNDNTVFIRQLSVHDGSLLLGCHDLALGICGHLFHLVNKKTRYKIINARL
jgi:hypothetical protein